MFKYSYQVKMEYEYIGNESYPRIITYEYEDMNYTDAKSGIRISLQKEFELSVSDVIAENRDVAFSIACAEMQKVCRVLTTLLQIQNYDNRECCPNLTILPYKVKLISEEEIEEPMNKKNGCEFLLIDKIRMNDGITGAQITQGLDLSLFEKLFCKMSDNNFINVGDVIYRAVIAQNVESRFFQLFTIIEALETKYGSEKDISRKMIQSDKMECVEEIIKNLPKLLEIDNEYGNRLKCRLMQIIKTATIKSRPEKLATIITKKYNITEVKKGLINYSVDSKKMKEFIEVRNKLFHGSHAESEEYNNLVQRTNELQELCLLLLD